MTIHKCGGFREQSVAAAPHAGRQPMMQRTAGARVSGPPIAVLRQVTGPMGNPACMVYPLRLLHGGPTHVTIFLPYAHRAAPVDLVTDVIPREKTDKSPALRARRGSLIGACHTTARTTGLGMEFLGLAQVRYVDGRIVVMAFFPSKILRGAGVLSLSGIFIQPVRLTAAKMLVGPPKIRVSSLTLSALVVGQ